MTPNDGQDYEILGSEARLISLGGQWSGRAGCPLPGYPQVSPGITVNGGDILMYLPGLPLSSEHCVDRLIKTAAGPGY